MTISPASNRIPTTCHEVTQRGRTPTRFSRTTTTLTPTPTLTATPDTTGCLRTSLARANHRFRSWWQQKIWAVCVEINDRPSHFCRSFAVTSEKLQPKSNSKFVLLTNHLRTVYRHKSNTAFSFCFSLFLDGTPLIFARFTWEVRHFVISGPIFGIWPLPGNKWRTACHRVPVYTQNTNKDKNIYLLCLNIFNLFIFFVYIPQFTSAQTVLFHGKHCTISSHYTL